MPLCWIDTSPCLRHYFIKARINTFSLQMFCQVFFCLKNITHPYNICFKENHTLSQNIALQGPNKSFGYCTSCHVLPFSHGCFTVVASPNLQNPVNRRLASEPSESRPHSSEDCHHQHCGLQLGAGFHLRRCSSTASGASMHIKGFKQIACQLPYI